MQFRYITLITSVLITIAIFGLSLINGKCVDIHLLGATQAIPLGLLTIVVWLSGWFMPLSYLIWRKESESNQAKKLKEWQQQDAKLSNEIVSDRQKQLEAKIATLEAALRSALKGK